MRWTPGRRSRNLEDRRADTGGRSMVRRGAPVGLGVLLLLGLLSLVTGENFLSLLGPGADQVMVPGSGPGTGGPGRLETTPEEERLVDFVSFVLDDAQAVWHRLLPGDYRDTQLVLFRDAIESACGFAESATGPFYCPGDRKVYIDLGFYDELARRFGAPGEFAQAYVLTHEIGHHLQTLLGLEARVRQLQQANPRQANDLSVRLELQADCFAGVWGHSTLRRSLIDRADIDDGLRAAASIGDDRLQKMSTGRVQPERFTHGSSAERVAWFRRGLETGDVRACDTFSAPRTGS